MTQFRTVLVLACAAGALPLAGCGDDASATGDGATDDGSRADSGADADLDAEATEDAGDDAPTTVPCGDVTSLGECDGRTVRFCIEGALQEIDCSAYYRDVGGTGSCEFISADLGYFCALQAGDACVFADAGGSPMVELCAGTNAACVLLAERSECRVDVGACTGDETTGVCNGDNLLLDCIQTQPYGVDCAALGGGTCDAAGTLGSCVGLGEGSGCRAGTPTAPALSCAGGLTCEGETADTLGTCTAP